MSNDSNKQTIHGDESVDVGDIDDAVGGNEPRQQEQQQDGGEGGEPIEGPQLRRRFDSDRNEIYKRARELRAAEQEPGQKDEQAEQVEPEPEKQEPEAKAERQDDAKREPAPVLGDDAEIELVVYGVPVKKKISEIKADAQKLLAADAKFEEAKRAATEARELLKEAQSQRSKSSEEHHQDDDAESGKKASRNKADQPDDEVEDVDVDSIAERLQVGDRNEGKEAIAELVKLVRGRNTSAVDQDRVERVVEERLERNRTKQEIDTAVEKFSQAFPKIVKDDDLVDVALRQVSKEIKADLLANGLSEDDLGKFTDPGELVKFHAQVRRTNRSAKLRSYDEVLTSVGTKLTSKFGALLGNEQPENQKPAQQRQPVADKAAQRVEAKRAAPQQPRASGVRTESSAPAPKTHAQILAEIRNSRPAFRRR